MQQRTPKVGDVVEISSFLNNDFKVYGPLYVYVVERGVATFINLIVSGKVVNAFSGDVYGPGRDISTVFPRGTAYKIIPSEEWSDEICAAVVGWRLTHA